MDTFGVICMFVLLCTTFAQDVLDDSSTNKTTAAKFNQTIHQAAAALWTQVDINNDTKFTSQDMDLTLADFDTNKDGNVSEHEFVTNFANNSANLGAISDELFSDIDMNHDGVITPRDLHLYYENMDSNKDGSVEKEEFIDYFSKVLVILLQIELKGATTAVPSTTQSPYLNKFQQIIDGQVASLWLGIDSNNDTKFTVADIASIFSEYDTNNDSAITEPEFIPRFTNNRPQLDVIAKGLFSELDMNHDGSIRRDDLVLYYKVLDANDDGTVSEQEFTVYFRKLMTILYAIYLKSGNFVG